MRAALIVAAALSFIGCPLHNPVPVEPDYPPPEAHVVDAGAR